MRYVSIFDKWDHFDVIFKVFNPFVKKDEVMRINGDHKSVGNWTQHGPQHMEQSKHRASDLKAEKYGLKLKPYEFKSVFH